MTQKEKAKAYDKAIDKIADAVEAGTIEQGLAEWLFPELRESEDEKIRKTLIHIVKGACDKYGIKYQGKEISEEKLLAWLEKQGETKFREGEWVVFNDKHESVYQIEKIENFQYTLRHILGGLMPLSFSREDMIRAWTIQDAKVGDVLAAEVIGEKYSSPFIAIYKERGLDFFNSYCFVTLNGEFVDEGDTRHDIKDIHPATIEQRDILFTKMKEAGYGWDVEHKQLKKIEQKPTEWSLPYGKNETAEKLIALAECLESDGECLFNGLSSNDYGKFLRVLAIELTKVKPTAWSEEDEQIKRDIENLIHFALRDGSAVSLAADTTKEDALGWLNDLKNRFHSHIKS